jgi:hypothetical protein
VLIAVPLATTLLAATRATTTTRGRGLPREQTWSRLFAFVAVCFGSHFVAVDGPVLSVWSDPTTKTQAG